VRDEVSSEKSAVGLAEVTPFSSFQSFVFLSYFNPFLALLTSLLKQYNSTTTTSAFSLLTFDLLTLGVREGVPGPSQG
jgi:hypothetical protein